jgi:hypothetical protein
MSDEMQQLRGEWHQVYGTDIPYRVEILGPNEIRKALEHGRQKQLQPVSETSGNDDSLLDSDNHNNYT